MAAAYQKEIWMNAQHYDVLAQKISLILEMLYVKYKGELTQIFFLKGLCIHHWDSLRAVLPEEGNRAALLKPRGN